MVHAQNRETYKLLWSLFFVNECTDINKGFCTCKHEYFTQKNFINVEHKQFSLQVCMSYNKAKTPQINVWSRMHWSWHATHSEPQTGRVTEEEVQKCADKDGLSAHSASVYPLQEMKLCKHQQCDGLLFGSGKSICVKKCLHCSETLQHVCQTDVTHSVGQLLSRLIVTMRLIFCCCLPAAFTFLVWVCIAVLSKLLFMI